MVLCSITISRWSQGLSLVTSKEDKVWFLVNLGKSYIHLDNKVAATQCGSMAFATSQLTDDEDLQSQAAIFLAQAHGKGLCEVNCFIKCILLSNILIY